MAEAWLSETGDERFFGWVHFISPHTPYEYREESAHLAPPMNEGRFAQTTGGAFEVADEAELRRVRDLYDGEVYFADLLFGRILAIVDKLGLRENTIVVLTADHGEEFMDHGQVQHNSLFEEVIRIPMILGHPRMERGVRTPIPWINTDLMPTLTGMVGVTPPTATDGIDWFSGASTDRARVVTAMTNRDRFEVAIERGGMKLVLRCTPEYAETLYDLEADPGERSDRILDDPGAATRLFDTLANIMGGEPCAVVQNANRGIAPERALDDEQIEKLKSLGYIQ